jgi:hypothetical protein
MAQLYSQRFLAVQGLNGDTATVTVPAGFVYIVRQATFYSNPLVSPARGFLVDEDSGAALFSCGTAAGTPAWFGFFGALVFEEGQRFHWKVTAGLGDGADVYAGGYALVKP